MSDQPQKEPEEELLSSRQWERRQIEQQDHWIPRPPRIRTAADFIVIVFAVTVATILVLLTVGTMIAAIFTDTDIKSYFAILTSIMTSIISALVGYLAGKGQTAQAEIDKQQQQQK